VTSRILVQEQQFICPERLHQVQPSFVFESNVELWGFARIFSIQGNIYSGLHVESQSREKVDISRILIHSVDGSASIAQPSHSPTACSNDKAALRQENHACSQ
jgi:hypothetical protein